MDSSPRIRILRVTDAVVDITAPVSCGGRRELMGYGLVDSGDVKLAICV